MSFRSFQGVFLQGFVFVGFRAWRGRLDKGVTRVSRGGYFGRKFLHLFASAGRFFDLVWFCVFECFLKGVSLL